MLICLTGSHSTGKTTLVEFFKNEKNYESIGSVTRKVLLKEQRKVEEGVSDESQRRVLEAIKESMNEIRKKVWENPSKIYILDRCVFDFLAYTKAFRDKGWCTDEFVEYAEKEIKDFIEEYDIVFYLPIEFNCVDDGVRSMDEDLRKSVDKYIQEAVLWNKTRAVKLTGSVLQRVQKIKNTVEKLMEDSVELYSMYSYAGEITSYIPDNLDEKEDAFALDLINLWKARNLEGFYFFYDFETAGSSEVVGFVLLEGKGDAETDNTIRGLYVAPRWRGKGIGRKLVEEALKVKHKNFWVNVTDGAEEFYEKLGFKKVGRRVDFPDQTLYYHGPKDVSELGEIKKVYPNFQK